MHFYWSHLEAWIAYPLSPATSSLRLLWYLYSGPCTAGNCSPISEMAADLRHLLSGKAGGLKKKRVGGGVVDVWLYSHYVWLPQSQHGVQSCVFIAFAQSEWSPLPLSVCSLPLLCSLSEDWGEPVAPRDEGLLRDPAAVCGPGEQRLTEVTGCWRGSVAQNSTSQSTHSAHFLNPSCRWTCEWGLSNITKPTLS